MIRRLLNLLMASLLVAAGSSAVWAVQAPSEPSCCGEACPCPAPPRPAPQTPGSPTPEAPVVQVQAQSARKPRTPEPSPVPRVAGDQAPPRSETPSANEVPDPPEGNRRQSQLGIFRN